LFLRSLTGLVDLVDATAQVFDQVIEAKDNAFEGLLDLIRGRIHDVSAVFQLQANAEQGLNRLVMQAQLTVFRMIPIRLETSNRSQNQDRIKRGETIPRT